jgi:hypothetical protein
VIPVPFAWVLLRFFRALRRRLKTGGPSHLLVRGHDARLRSFILRRVEGWSLPGCPCSALPGSSSWATEIAPSTVAGEIFTVLSSYSVLCSFVVAGRPIGILWVSIGAS